MPVRLCYYVSMLPWVGCVADTPALAGWFGDVIAHRLDSFTVDLAGLPRVRLPRDTRGDA
jgi:hypothetical protein